MKDQILEANPESLKPMNVKIKAKLPQYLQSLDRKPTRSLQTEKTTTP